MEKDEYHVEVARTAKEAIALIEQGFEYVTDIGGVIVSRRRKQKHSR